MINRYDGDLGIPGWIFDRLPYRISDAIRKNLRVCGGALICEEIRMRCGRMSYITLSGGDNIPLDVSLTREEMDRAVDRLCKGSLYAYTETINRGYIMLPDGMRAGVSGRATVEKGRIIGISEINGICIRIPHHIKTDVFPICNILREFSMMKGVLVYSLPGAGKTTLLRNVAAEMSKGTDAVRVVVVDERGELEFGLRARGLCLDLLYGYPKAIGIEVALRTMGAQLIVCDEIGNDDEISPICNAAVGGAALLASAHASDIEALLSKKNITELHNADVFGAYVGIKRSGSEVAYEITYRREIC